MESHHLPSVLLAMASFYSVAYSHPSIAATAFTFHHHAVKPTMLSNRGYGVGPRPTSIAPRRNPSSSSFSASIPSDSALYASSASYAASSSEARMMANIENLVSNAIENWSIEVTPFMEMECADVIEREYENRVDVVIFRLVGGRRPIASSESSPSSKSGSSSSASSAGTHPIGEGRRCRFVLTHPDLGMDVRTAEIQHSCVIRIDNVDLNSSNTIPNALASIGVSLEHVGDVVVTPSPENAVYLVVDPNVAKRCTNLLSKELRGIGISVSSCDDAEFMPHGEIVEMKLSKMLERQLDRKGHGRGYVRFG